MTYLIITSIAFGEFSNGAVRRVINSRKYDRIASILQTNNKKIKLIVFLGNLSEKWPNVKSAICFFIPNTSYSSKTYCYFSS